MTIVRSNNMRIDKNVVIMNSSLFVVVGGITVEDDVFVAANAQSISNNYYLYDHQILTYKPIRLKRNCWIGAGVAYSAERYGK